MNKKYQFFISSTYEDLKEERNAAIHAILTMNQFPVGMEMFSAANEEQWQIIKEAIDDSDYYVLIVANKYGSVIETGEDAGISYTEKEFNYAVEKGIPVLAFNTNILTLMELQRILINEKRESLRRIIRIAPLSLVGDVKYTMNARQ